MNIVVDANILFSALITPDGKIARILTYPLSSANFISGHLLVEELLKHQAKIIRCAKRNEQDVLENMHYLLKSLTLFAESLIAPEYWIKSEELTKEVDHFDISYVALSLQEDALLWTGDKKLTNHLKMQGFNSVITTSELYKLFQIG